MLEIWWYVVSIVRIWEKMDWNPYVFCSRGLFKIYIFFPPDSYENQEIALNCGMMLRECCRHEALAKIMLYSDDFYKFFEYVEVSTFDIASDAFSTFKVRQQRVDFFSYL